MKINELINWLESRPRTKPKEDLNKIKHALSLLSKPQDDCKTIHIAGTNGKGSTAKFITSVLSEIYSVGLFTSPYVVKFNERIQLNNVPISDDDLAKYIIWAQTFIADYETKYNESFSFFELLTIIAYKYFSDKKVDYAIIEVGIGGYLDSTNVINSVVSVITSVGLDHQQQLGSTIEEILLQKCGIVHPGGTLITGLIEHHEIIDSYINKVDAQVKYIDLKDYQLVNNFPLQIMYKNNIYTSYLVGLYQINNLITALNVINYILPELSVDVVQKGISKATNPGRFEIVNQEPVIILDGAHNVEAIKKISESITTLFKDKKVYILYVSMVDKAYYEMLKLLNEITNEVYLTTLPYPRAFRDFNNLFDKYKIIEDPILAFNEILSVASKDDVILVTGSMYLVSEIRKLLVKETN